MSDIFLKLLNMSLTASWLIVVVVILRLIVRKTPRWIICLLWGFVAIRLVCPFSIESPFGLVPSDEVIPKNILSEAHHKLYITTGVKTLDAMVNGYLGDTYHEVTSVVYDYGNILMSKLGVIWICGVFGLLLYVVIMNLRLRRHLKESILLQEKICLCDYVRSPFIFGFFHPYIYLPSGIDESDMEYVIAHEKAHLQRGDHIWKMAAFLILAIYWFNPLSWIAFILFCKDIELACDEKVIKNMSAAEKKEYSESLLSCSFKKRIAIVYPLAFGELGVKQRVKSILSYKKPTFAVLFLSFLAVIVIGICFLTNASQEYQFNESIPTDLSPALVQTKKKEIELQQVLLDYDKDNITEVAVLLQDLDNVDSSANIVVVGKEKVMDEDEQNNMKTIASEYLNIDGLNIYLVYVDSETLYSH